MQNQLINLSLLNGGTPLSEKTLTNLDLYLRNKYQTAGSSSTPGTNIEDLNLTGQYLYSNSDLSTQSYTPSYDVNQFSTELDRVVEEIDRAKKAEKREIKKRINVTENEAKVRKQQIIKVEKKILETKRDLTSSIDELTSTVETIEAKFESQSVINQQMVDVLRKLNSENLENQEKLRKIKKTPFGAFI